MPSIAVEENDPRTAFDPLLSEIVRMSREFFPGSITVEVMSDPDAPSVSWTVLNVESDGADRAIIQTQCEWHERLAQQFPNAVSTVRLSIEPCA
ncbi:MAG: hypothetical protein ACKV2Q_21305 [Planctomycetaceae bacterium]